MKIYAIKANRMVEISEDEKQKYQNAGYKIALWGASGIRFEVPDNPESKVIQALEEENAALKERLASLESESEEEPEEEPKKPPASGRRK